MCTPRISGRRRGESCQDARLIVGEESHPVLAEAVRPRVFGKSPIAIYIRLNRWVWSLLPRRLCNLYPMRKYGGWLNILVRLQAARQQYFGTFFLRNRPALELMCRLAEEKTDGSTLRIAVLGCSIGAEVYSILWAIRSIRPDLKVFVCAVDISTEILKFAENGVYTPSASDLVGSSIFERLTPHELKEMFDWNGEEARVKPWLREGITWWVGDASDPELIWVVGPQDMVVASNFLCHMDPRAAERCLRNIARLVNPGGSLFVSGVDLEVREKVARELRWKPILDLIEQIHNGDPSVCADWPWEWWGLEPIDYRRRDWQMRYGVAFRLNGTDRKL
jgi:chemotaxis methyl-accepting protein methylase